MNLDDLVTTERQFLKEVDGEMNEKGVYFYQSQNEKHFLKLDYFLKEYKDWLIKKGIVREK